MAARIKKQKGDLDEDELPMNQTPEASKMTTNSPRRATPKSVQVGGPYDLTAEATDDGLVMQRMISNAAVLKVSVPLSPRRVVQVKPRL